MSMIRLILASLRYHWRMNATVAMGVAAAVAVLTGALLVGDSMRGSLRRLALERLGRIDVALVADRFFGHDLAEQVEKHFVQESRSDAPRSVVPVILLQANLTNPGDPERVVRANGVTLIGCDASFWKLGDVAVVATDAASNPSRSPTDELNRLPEGRRIVLNRPLAEQLGVHVGDSVVVRVSRPQTIPAETPLGRRDATEQMRLTVGAVIEPRGLGIFGLSPTQHAPRNAYVDLETLQLRLAWPNRVNAVLVSTGKHSSGSSPDDTRKLAEAIQPRLDDYGLRVVGGPRGGRTLSTDRLVFSRRVELLVERAALEIAPDSTLRPTLTYLANTIGRNHREIPYSTVAALDFTDRSPLGPWLDIDGRPIAPLGPGEIVLNAWAANDLVAAVGDTVRVTYFEPESLHGRLVEKTAEFRLVAIVPISGPAADRDLLPEVPGVTDQLAMDDWNPPFPFDAERIRQKDEDYWDDHRGTPKAFISLSDGRALWSSRFGQTTTLGVYDVADATVESESDDESTEFLSDEDFDRKLASLLPADEMGLVWQPVRWRSLDASDGTTSFNLLFLGFSSFIILSALMLVVLLFRLGVDLRCRQIGTLLALGWTGRKIGVAMLAEGAVTAAVGSLLGIVLGIGYAWLMVLGLRTWWLPAVATPFVRLHPTAASLFLGLIVGLLLSLVVIALAVRRIGLASVRVLMSGSPAENPLGKPLRRRRVGPAAFAAVLIIATASAVLFARIGEEFQAGAFFGAGSLVLLGLIAAVGWQLRLGRAHAAIRAGRGNLARLALLGAARHPGRGTLSLGLVAAACFLIISVSAFRIDPSAREPRLDSGNGRFSLVAESDLPIHHDLGTSEGRRDLGFTPEDDERLSRCVIVSFRVKPGDDASCLNLYQPGRPRLLGVPETMIRRGGFAWAAASDKGNPWRALETRTRDSEKLDRPVPMVLERDTAVYSLHLGGKLGATYELADSAPRNSPLETVGLLKGSPFQGDLLVSEDELLRLFPEVDGYRFFLIECPPDEAARIGEILARTLGDRGFVSVPMAEYLDRFLAVPNTYLSTFQSLGGLGLLLGTFGLAIVQTRNVVERRRELALLRAVGLGESQIAWLVVVENGILLVAGMACGIAAAVVAVLPHFVAGDASIPWESLAGMLLLILAIGLAAGLVAVRAALASPILESLREE